MFQRVSRDSISLLKRAGANVAFFSSAKSMQFQRDKCEESEEMLKTLLDGHQGGELYDLAKENLHNRDPRLFSVNLQNPLKNQSLNLKLNNTSNTLSAVSYYLRKNKDILQNHSIFGMNFPGTNSLVLHWDKERLMVRIYTVDFSNIHGSHFYRNWTTHPFLWHSHGYNFISLPLLDEGLTQERAIVIPEGETIQPSRKQTMQRLTYKSPVLNQDIKPSQIISYHEMVDLTKHPIENKRQGEAYFMHTSSEIHRVGFTSSWRDPNTFQSMNLANPKQQSMSAVLFFEFRNFTEEDYLRAGYPSYEVKQELKKRERAYIQLPPTGQEITYKREIVSVVSGSGMFKKPSPKEVETEVEKLLINFKN